MSAAPPHVSARTCFEPQISEVCFYEAGERKGTERRFSISLCMKPCAVVRRDGIHETAFYRRERSLKVLTFTQPHQSCQQCKTFTRNGWRPSPPPDIYLRY